MLNYKTGSLVGVGVALCIWVRVIDGGLIALTTTSATAIESLHKDSVNHKTIYHTGNFCNEK